MAIPKKEASPNLQDKYFLWVPIFAYFIEDQKITLGKKACAVETYANPLAIGFLVIWVHIAKVYIHWS